MKEFLKIMGLNRTDFEVFRTITDRSCRTVGRLSELLGKDRSVIQRSLNKLVEKELVERKSKCCDQKKGRYFIYCSNNKTEKVLKKECEKILKKALEVIK